jgi:SpoVK/Ycf46/Vps4 family AAA+-type ATPase
MTKLKAIALAAEPVDPPRIGAPRSPHSELVRRWLFRLRAVLPRPFVFPGPQPKADEEDCVRNYHKFTRLPALRPYTWEKLDGYVAIALHVEDPKGGLVELPTTPALTCLKELAHLCGFSEVELHILALGFLLGCEEGLQFFSPGLTKFRTFDMITVIAGVIGTDAATVATALKSTGPLVSSGLLQVKLDGEWDDFLEVPFSLRYGLLLPPENAMDLLRSSLAPAPSATLHLGDYPHLSPNIAVMKSYLKAATTGALPGVNVLLHGRPGTGKTQLVRALAADLGLKLQEVALLDECGNPRKAIDRIRAFAIGQRLLGRSRDTLLLFDEAEASFAASGEFKDPALAGLKAWLNQTLETNPVPAVWITNDVASLDPAFLRRFDLVLQVDVPPRSVRRGIIAAYLADLPVLPMTLECLADHEGLAPAVVATAAKVVTLAGGTGSPLDVDATIRAVIDQHLATMGAMPLKVPARASAVRYSVSYVNVSVDPMEVLEGLRGERRGRLCLYGPPGTGKTAYAAFLAQELDRPLQVKRASDLLSKWVGGTEKNIREMFHEAAQDNAVLLLDEADGFLADRRGAQQHWEATMVNELLTRLEDYTGIFIGTTNRLESMDAAALRRFDLKVAFGYMKPHQAWCMFQETSAAMGLTPCGSAKEALEKLTTLTPSDFTRAAEQSRFTRCATQDDLITRLQVEVRFKPGGRRQPLGF